MPRKPNVLPSYLLHKQSGQARVRINGRDHLLGEYGSECSRIAYGELIAKISGGIPIDPFKPSKRGSLPRNESEADPGPSVGELCLVFLQHAETHYVKNGKQTSEVHILKSVIRPLNELYGLIPANEFGPLALKAVRARMIESGWKRNTINAAMSRIRRIFKHAIANELIDASVLQRLQTVAPLLAGRTEATDNPPGEAVDAERIETVRKLVRPMMRDLIDLQRLTGARSGELLQLTTGGINRTGDVWAAELSDHKTCHHGQRSSHYSVRPVDTGWQYHANSDVNHRGYTPFEDAFQKSIRLLERLTILGAVRTKTMSILATAVPDAPTNSSITLVFIGRGILTTTAASSRKLPSSNRSAVLRRLGRMFPAI